mmetsp:Transcript_35790/g.70413  ORF Transcript_35790/g.70413 Transcript_35790/m.70413 type:complete len:241 (+) Transcript_35790:1037-1759(+)
MLLWRHVAQHGRAERCNVGGTDRRSDVVVPGGNVRGEGTESVEGSLVTPLQLVAHIHRNLVQGNVSRTFVHDLHVLLPGAEGELSLCLEFRKLGLVVCVVDASGSEAVTDGERNVVLGTDIENIVPVFPRKVLFVVENVPFGVDRSSTGYNTRLAVNRHGYEREKDSCVDREVVHPLLCLFNKGLTEHLPAQVFGYSVNLLQSLVYGDGPDRNRTVSHDPFPGLVDVPSGTQVHERVPSP